MTTTASVTVCRVYYLHAAVSCKLDVSVRAVRKLYTRINGAAQSLSLDESMDVLSMYVYSRFVGNRELGGRG